MGPEMGNIKRNFMGYLKVFMCFSGYESMKNPLTLTMKIQ